MTRGKVPSQTCCPGCGVTLQNKQQEEEMPETKERLIATPDWVHTPEWVLSNLLLDNKNPSKKDKINKLRIYLKEYEEVAEDPSEAGAKRKEAEKAADSFYDAIMQITNGRHYDNFI